MSLNERMLGGLVVTILTAGLVAAHAGVGGYGRSRNAKASIEGGAAKHEMSASDLKAKLDSNQSIIIIDARTELDGRIIKGAIHVPLSKLEEWARGADKKAVVVTYCTCPHDEAAEAEMQKLREMGFENAFILTGGLDAARKAGIAIVAPGE